jgi:hypothetical protein
MMHLEQEKLNGKLKVMFQKQFWIKLIQIVASKIALGSLVKANGIYLYLSLALPKITIDEVNVIALSRISAGNKLIGNSVGYTFEINKTKYLVEEIS